MLAQVLVDCLSAATGGSENCDVGSGISSHSAILIVRYDGSGAAIGMLGHFPLPADRNRAF